MASTLKDDPFLYRNHYPLPIRAMIAMFALILMLIPYGLLVAPRWNHFSFALVPYSLVSLVALALAFILLYSVILGKAQETRLDFENQCLVQTGHDWLFHPRETHIRFDEISIVEVDQPEWAGHEEVFTITPVLQNGDSLSSFGAFPAREEAEKIAILMGYRPDGFKASLNEIIRTWSSTELAALKMSIEAASESHSGEWQGEIFAISDSQNRP